MPLKEFERLAVDAVLGHLSATWGGHWCVNQVLEDIFRNEPVPEVLLTNGAMTAAVEVKDLGFATGNRRGVNESLRRRLKPPCGGSFELYLGPENLISMDRGLIRYLAKEIKRFAPKMSDGETVAVPLRRSALVIFREGVMRAAYCLHDDSDGLFAPLRDQLPGCVFVRDEKLGAHTFFTERRRELFLELIKRTSEDIAARRLRSGEPICWYEEAELTCVNRDGGEDDGVTVLNALVSNASDVSQYTEAEVRKAVGAALPKFRRSPRWADLQVLVLRAGAMTPHEHVSRSLARISIEPDMAQSIDEVLLLRDGGCELVWSGNLDFRH